MKLSLKQVLKYIFLKVTFKLGLGVLFCTVFKISHTYKVVILKSRKALTNFPTTIHTPVFVAQ